MDTICLEFTSELDNPEFTVLIDGRTAKTIVDNKTVVVTHDSIPFGFHLLEISLSNLANFSPIVFTKATLNGVDFRQTLYTMFVDKNRKRQTTTLTLTDDVLYLPFINPVSAWIASCAEKISTQLYTRGLYDELEVYYPESIQLPTEFPQIVRDFFAINMDFYVHPKKRIAEAYCNTEVPFVSIADKLSYNEQLLTDELLNNIKYLQSCARIPPQTAYNKSESTSNNYWSVVDFILSTEDEYSLTSKFSLDKAKVPHLYSLFEQLNLDKIIHAFIGILAPGEFIAPHTDQYTGFEFVINKYGGCSQIYIPINFKEGNYFKFNNIGLLPLDKAPLLINNHNFTHSVINNSNEYRFALAIVGTPLK